MSANFMSDPPAPRSFLHDLGGFKKKGGSIERSFFFWLVANDFGLTV